jgi:hypothetical protein
MTSIALMRNFAGCALLDANLPFWRATFAAEPIDSIRYVGRKTRDDSHARHDFAERGTRGARQLNRLRWNAKVPDFDPGIAPLIRIDSETDSLPRKIAAGVSRTLAV